MSLRAVGLDKSGSDVHSQHWWQPHALLSCYMPTALACGSGPDTMPDGVRSGFALFRPKSRGLVAVNIGDIHFWPSNIREAREIQNRLRHRIDVTASINPAAVKYVAGVDVAYAISDDRVASAVIILDLETFKVVETQVAIGVPKFDYVPGLFAFRELPIIVDAMRKIDVAPDLIVCDGHGIAHPARFGLACHLGLLTNIPAFGVAKTRLIGSYVDPGKKRSEWSPLTDGDEIIGRVVRTQDNVKPVFVSAGHHINVADAMTVTLKLCRKYRLPETTRIADQLSRRTLAAFDQSE